MAVSDINTVVLSGRLTRDPEARGGGSVAAFSMASNRWYYKNEERIEETVFIDVSAFGYEAKSVMERLSKGSRVTVIGRLELSKWEASDGSNRQQIRLVAQSVHSHPSPSSTTPTPEATSEPAATQVAEPVAAGAPSADDIPF